MTITVDGFLSRIKRRITVPSNQVLLTNDEMLAMADDVMKERMIPLILSVNQNYFVYEDFVEGVEDQEAYDIPYRSIGRGLRDLQVRWGDEPNGWNNMTQIALEDAHMWGNNALSNSPWAFYFRGDKFVVVPLPTTSDFTLRLYYNMQPNELVQSSDACLVESINDNIITCAAVDTSIYAPGVLVDFIKGRSGCATMSFDIELSSSTATTLTFASADDIPEDLAAGDWVSFAQTSPVVQLPDEAGPMFDCWSAERILYAIGDFEGAQILAQRAVEIEKNLRLVLTPRIEGAQTKIVNRNGLLRGPGRWPFRIWNGGSI